MYLHVEEREQGEGADCQTSFAFLPSAERLRRGHARWERAIDGTTGRSRRQLHRNLVEYELSRQLSHSVGPRHLRGEDWGYMFAEHPFEAFPRTDFVPSWFEEELFECRDRATGNLKWTGTRVGIIFGSKSQPRALVQV